MMVVGVPPGLMVIWENATLDKVARKMVAKALWIKLGRVFISGLFMCLGLVGRKTERIAIRKMGKMQKGCLNAGIILSKIGFF